MLSKCYALLKVFLLAARFMLISCVDDNNGFGSHEAVALTHFGLILPSVAAVMQVVDTLADATSLEVRKRQGRVDD